MLSPIVERFIACARDVAGSPPPAKSAQVASDHDRDRTEIG
jgi:hypothetical protein